MAAGPCHSILEIAALFERGALEEYVALRQMRGAVANHMHWVYVQMSSLGRGEDLLTWAFTESNNLAMGGNETWESAAQLCVLLPKCLTQVLGYCPQNPEYMDNPDATVADLGNDLCDLLERCLEPDILDHDKQDLALGLWRTRCALKAKVLRQTPWHDRHRPVIALPETARQAILMCKHLAQNADDLRPTAAILQIDELLVLFSRTLTQAQRVEPRTASGDPTKIEDIEEVTRQLSSECELRAYTNEFILTLVVQTRHILPLRVCKSVAADEGVRHVVAKKLSERVAFRFNSKHRDREPVIARGFKTTWEWLKRNSAERRTSDGICGASYYKTIGPGPELFAVLGDSVYYHDKDSWEQYRTGVLVDWCHAPSLPKSCCFRENGTGAQPQAADATFASRI